MPVRPIHPGPGIHPLPGQRLVAVDRGPVAKGPWAFSGAAPRPDHQQALNFNGRTVAPVGRVDVRSQSFTAAKGTAPGTRAVLSGAPAGWQRASSTARTWRRQSARAGPKRILRASRPNVGYPAADSHITSVRPTWPGHRRPPRTIRLRRLRLITRLRPSRIIRRRRPLGHTASQSSPILHAKDGACG